MRTELTRYHNKSLLSGTDFRPISNAVLLPGPTKLSELIQFDFNTTFETQPCSTAELAVLHGSSTTWFQTSCYCRAETFKHSLTDIFCFGVFVSNRGKAFCFGTAINSTELNLTSETKPCYNRASLVRQ